MKKYISVLIVCILISSVFTIPSYAFGKKTAENTEASILLSNLGIITSDDDSEFVARGEYADKINKLLKINGVLSVDSFPYIDVEESYPYYNSISNLYGYKIISAAEKFRPNDNVTASEAVKMAVSALGYDYLAQSLGGYPHGYFMAATQLGLSVQSGNAALSRSDIYEMLFSMMMCKLSTVTYGDEIYFHKESGATLLEAMWNVNIVTGTIDDVQYFGKNHENGIGEGFVSIEGKVLKKGDFDTDSMFGEYVDAYYDIDSNRILSIYSYENNNNIVKLHSYQEPEFDDGIYSYYDDNGKLKTKVVPVDCLIIYNGRKSEYDEKIMNPEHGYVKFVSNDKNKIEVIIIKSYIQALADAIITSERMVSDKLNGVSYVFDDSQIVFTNQSGIAVSFSTIEKNSVLWIAKDADGTIQEVKICNDVISGEMTGKNSAGIVYLDDREFMMSDYAKKQIETFNGGVLVACLNLDGEIACFVDEDSEDSDLQIGYLMRSALMLKGLSGKISAKILNSEGEIETFGFADTFTLNGITFKASPQEIYSSLPKQPEMPSSMMLSLVSYKVNNKSELVEVNYPDNIAQTFGGKDNTLFFVSEISNAADKYIQYSPYYLQIVSTGADRIFPTLTTKRFMVPLTEDCASASDSDYSVVELSASYLKQSHVGYSLVENDLTSSYIVSSYTLGNSAQTVSPEATTYLVNEVNLALDADGNPAEKLSLVSVSGQATEFYSKEIGYLSKFNLGFGDIIKLEADKRGVVKGINILYRSGNNTFSNESSFASSGLSVGLEGCSLTSSAGMGTLGSFYILLGTVFRKNGNAMLVLPSNVNPDEYNNETLYGASLYRQTALVCDLEKESTQTAGAADVIKDYESFGSNASKVVVEMRSGQVVGIFAYK